MTPLACSGLHFVLPRSGSTLIEQILSSHSLIEGTTELQNITFIETWIKEDDTHDKSLMYGFDDMPIGTWFGMAKINDDDTWEKIKAGEVKGFSIEGRYCDELLKASLETVEEEIELLGTDEEKKLYKDILDLIEQLDLDE